jgi:PAS domain S-box-containing protein
MKSDGSILLLVDSDRRNLTDLTEVLAAGGYSLRSAHSGALALAAADAWLPALILLGVRLPDISGLEVCRLLKENDHTRHIPILLTGVLAGEERVRGLAMGAADVISTAMHREELLTRVRIHLETAHGRTEAERLQARTSAELRTALRQLQVEAAERRRMLTAMRKSEELTVLAMQVGPTYAFEWNPRTNEVSRSRDCADLLGLCDEATSEKWEDCIERVHTDDREMLLRRIQGLTPAYDTCECDYRVVRPDSRIVHLHAVIRGFFSRAGVAERYIGVVADTTRARVAEAALARSEDSFRSLADAAPLMICASGPDRLATYFNHAWLDFTGRTLAQELNYGWTEAVHPEDLDRTLAGYSASFSAHRNCHLEYRLRRADGEYRWISCSGVPRWSADGAFAGYIASCVDVTDVKRAQLDAFDQQKLESMRLLAGGIAHDLNNLLSAIQAQAELVEAEAAAGLSPEIAIRRLRGVATRAAEIVRELLVYSGEDKATLEPVNLSHVIAEMRELLQISISKHAVLGMRLADGLPSVLGNVTQIRQVIMNLVINASQAIGDRDGAIRVETSHRTVSDNASTALTGTSEGEYVCIEIADTGSGMTEEARRHIFERSYTTKAGGHGMGLAVVHGIVRSHGGVVGVTSAPGLGTTFEVLLPCAADLVGSALRIPAARAGAAAGSKRVLFVEEEDHLRISVAKALRRRGFSVISQPDDAAAMEVFRDRADQIDIVVLDLSASEKSGLETMRQLRLLRDGLPVILTGTAGQGGAPAASRGVSFLRKPYRIEDLVERLQNSTPGDDAHTDVAEAG